MAKKSRNRATKAEVQTTEGNKLPAPELDAESATEIVYGTENNPASRSEFRKQDAE
ncbi:hypothetical protein [Cohnella caldifontis]|uniref:hypothetical protein n=1 Tax=Cohnella caldifontis TaxID=3027471 RepID=UPI0023ED7AE2|nr:hypothetical protein [Cohnella sp. YIM B05605]